MPPEFYLFILAILLLTAVADLVVGVSNDAVNFLNSAIGSRVADRKVIMTVASIGILLGATFSNGMMEVARKGIFNPALFSYADVMVIFLAVMLTDILLLDLFNTFGLPTSTTVSIIFELLGAAVAVAVFKIITTGETLSEIGRYINASSTLTIISGIFLSVSIAFVVGSVVQWISRLLFSFQYERRLPIIGGIWTGLAMAAISYFLVFKGLKGSSFISESAADWISGHSGLLLLLSFAFWAISAQVLLIVFRVNVLRMVVLFGTFALAMAFAGNDLVNFIGVPLAGLDAFLHWKASGIAPGAFMMDSLERPVRTETWILLLAGAIMIVTLWFSKKARSVTETEVNLARQDDGSERFPSNRLARGIVWYTRKSTTRLTRLIPSAWMARAESSFAAPATSPGGETPAFDLIRASVNLTAAASLIALATSMKLPLSTTYVSFMVAMGTSLADRAWGRGSAVYRVAGVLNVIGGWFLTAVIAFSVASSFAAIIFWGGLWGIGLLLLSAAALLLRTFIHHGNQERKKLHKEKHPPAVNSVKQAVDMNGKKAAELLRHTGKTYELCIQGLLAEDTAHLQHAVKELEKVFVDKGTLQVRLYRSLKHLNGDAQAAGKLYLKVYEIEQDTVQSISLIVNSCDNYVKDSLPPFSEAQQQYLTQLAVLFHQLAVLISNQLEKGDRNPTEAEALKWKILETIEAGLNYQINGLRRDELGMRNSALWFSLLLETRDLVTSADRFLQTIGHLEIA